MGGGRKKAAKTSGGGGRAPKTTADVEEVGTTTTKLDYSPRATAREDARLPDPTLGVRRARTDPRLRPDETGGGGCSSSPLSCASSGSSTTTSMAMMMETSSPSSFPEARPSDEPLDDDEVYTVYEIIDEDAERLYFYADPELAFDAMTLAESEPPPDEEEPSAPPVELDDTLTEKPPPPTKCYLPSKDPSPRKDPLPPKEPPKDASPSKNVSPSKGASPSIVASPERSVRRSTRIRTSVLKQAGPKGRGVVSRPAFDPAEKSAPSDPPESRRPASPTTFPAPASEGPRPVKVKSRWRRSSEMEMIGGGGSPATPPPLNGGAPKPEPPERGERDGSGGGAGEDDVRLRLSQFEQIVDNEYHCERTVSKEARRMTCDCFLTREEIERGELGCGDDCLNRLLMIECNSRCPVGNRCTNRRFQTQSYSKLRVIKTEKKGLGIQAVTDIAKGEFLMEYVGEVLNWDQFSQRAQEYSADKNRHHYFMFLKGDAVIDATLKGNVSRFINHSCDPNGETQKWTVNGELRIGFFSKKYVRAGEEITFDYQFQRYGKEALKCYCEASNCRGWIGEEPDSSEDEEEEEEIDETKKEIKPVLDTRKESIETLTNEEVVEMKGAKVDVPLEESKNIKNESEIENKPPESEIINSTTKKPRKIRTCRRKPKNLSDVLQDMDLEKEIKNLTKSGVKSQAHTLSLCRAMVRAKLLKEQISLLKLLASADLPCRRLFLDYRGLKLLSPWCENPDSTTRIEILTVLERLPISNITILRETKILANIEKWLSDAEQHDESTICTPITIDESTGSSFEESSKALEKKLEYNNSVPKITYTDEERSDIVRLSKLLLKSWATLQEAFKIPKKERIELMKEHERQANERKSRRDRDDCETDHREKWPERYHRPDRDKKRPIPTIVDVPRKSQLRIDDRVLTPVRAMSKEARRKEFAARVAHEEHLRRAQSMYPPSSLDPSSSTSTYRAPPVIPVNGHYVQTDYMNYNDQYYSPYSIHLPGNSPYANIPLPPPMTPQPIPTVIAMQTSSTSQLDSPNFVPQPIQSLVSPTVAPPVSYNYGNPIEESHYRASSQSAIVANAPQTIANDDSSRNAMASSGGGSENVSDVVRWTGVKLPRRWRSMKDPRGRTYYYHVKHRISQWLPPLYSPTYNSKDDTSDEEIPTEEDEEGEIQNHVSETVKVEDDHSLPSEKFIEGLNGLSQVKINGIVKGKLVSPAPAKKKRPNLVTERIISPRHEEDIIASKLDLKRYKENKEKLRRRKEMALAAAGCPDELNKYKKRNKTSKPKKVKEVLAEPEADEKTTRRIKELFTATMAPVMVHHLDPYRRPDCAVGRIVNTADFKHLARKLTHFVLYKELKQCRSVCELECTDSVKAKAKEFVRKYMAKYGPVYKRPPEEADC